MSVWLSAKETEISASLWTVWLAMAYMYVYSHLLATPLGLERK